ncbi:MAG: type II toxin-antitoxin system RelE/ParE family toxin [Terriglobales bacterium]
MKLPVEFLPEAETEYLAALAWYRERSPTAALKFEAEFSLSIEKIQEAPERWTPSMTGCRRFLLHQFPFAIVYQTSTNLIQVLAVAHCHRRPGYWRGRI